MIRPLFISIAICSLLQISTAAAVEREYWLAADEVIWDYAPSFPNNLINDKPFNQDQLVFVGSGQATKRELIGRTYRKAIYRAYSANFRALIPRVETQQHLGILGPVIRAEVGDTLIIHFRNNTRFPASLHPHGVFYEKSSEGAAYSDGSSAKDKPDDSIAPHGGGAYTYIWQVPARAGPGPNDASSIVWPYHSHHDSPRDINSGLIGALIITRKGQAKPDASPKDVDREFITLFNVFNENDSHYIDANITQFTDLKERPNSELFAESNLMHAMNGLLWGNNQGYRITLGERVRWHIIGMGTEVDIHTAHWHGVTLLHHGRRVDVTEIFPATVKTLDMQADNPGTWMFHCHVHDHIDAGMMALFHISSYR